MKSTFDQFFSRWTYFLLSFPLSVSNVHFWQNRPVFRINRCNLPISFWSNQNSQQNFCCAPLPPTLFIFFFKWKKKSIFQFSISLPPHFSWGIGFFFINSLISPPLFCGYLQTCHLSGMYFWLVYPHANVHFILALVWNKKNNKKKKKTI